MRGETGRVTRKGRSKPVFRSTLPMRGETCQYHVQIRCRTYFNPLSPCGERLDLAHEITFFRGISIHSPHAGRDRLHPLLLFPMIHFNPLSPCGERPYAAGDNILLLDFNPLSPCGERRCLRSRLLPCTHFNPLSPCGERLCEFNSAKVPGVFQSTLPMRGETIPIPSQYAEVSISIHSPHAGRDGILFTMCTRGSIFQSTLPMRGETRHARGLVSLVCISIHSPHAGRDFLRCCSRRRSCNFNPLSPCGERLEGRIWRSRPG